MLPLIRTLDVLEDSLARLSSINRLQREGRRVWEKVGEVCVCVCRLASISGIFQVIWGNLRSTFKDAQAQCIPPQISLSFLPLDVRDLFLWRDY